MDTPVADCVAGELDRSDLEAEDLGRGVSQIEQRDDAISFAKVQAEQFLIRMSAEQDERKFYESSLCTTQEN